MIDNITVIDIRGNGVLAEGISYIKLNSTGKQYVLYTLNETVENDLIKMYVAETGPSVGVAGSIPELDWNNLRNILLQLSRGEQVNDITHLNMSGVTFYVGEPKKLAIKVEKKQAFKDSQNKAMLAINQGNSVDEPAVMGPSSTTFFDSSVASSAPAPDEPAFVPSSEQVNIFAQPMQPAYPNSVPEPNVTPAPQPSVEAQAPQTNTIASEPVPSVAETPQPVVDNQAASIPNVNTNLQDSSVVEPQEVNASVDAQATVTREDAIKALEVLNNYFALTNTLPSELAQEISSPTSNYTTSEVPQQTATTPEVVSNISNDNMVSYAQTPSETFTTPVESVMPEQTVATSVPPVNSNIVQFPTGAPVGVENIPATPSVQQESPVSYSEPTPVVPEVAAISQPIEPVVPTMDIPAVESTNPATSYQNVLTPEPSLQDQPPVVMPTDIPVAMPTDMMADGPAVQMSSDQPILGPGQLSATGVEYKKVA